MYTIDEADYKEICQMLDKTRVDSMFLLRSVLATSQYVEKQNLEQLFPLLEAVCKFTAITHKNIKELNTMLRLPR
jgi:hypothetical protein